MLVVALGLAAVPGCGADNESDANKPSADLQRPRSAPTSPKADRVAPPTDLKDYIKNQKAPGKPSSEYSGR